MAVDDIVVGLAGLDEVRELTAIQSDTFDDDTRRHLGKPRGGPSGYDSLEACGTLIREGRMYSIRKDGALVGGAIVTENEDGSVRINRLFIGPGHQGQGIGRTALFLLEGRFPRAGRFQLDTPSWAIRNQHFYESAGYSRVGEALEPQHGFTLVLYEKRRG